MKLTYQGGARRPERAVQTGMDDLVTASAVATAPTPAAAWDALAPPVPFDPALRERLTGALARVLVASDAIVRGHAAFDGLAPGEEAPPEWVDRMAELHLQELEAYWALDDEAVAGAQAGGWTTTAAVADDPIARTAARARWQADVVRPPAAALWFDKLARRVEAAASGASALDAVRVAGRDLVEACVRHRFGSGRAS